MGKIFVFREAIGFDFPKTMLEENFEPRGRDNAQGNCQSQMEAIVFIIVQIVFTTRGVLKIEEDHPCIP